MKYSHNNEEQYINNFIKELGLTDNMYVDVGASNGIHMSNTLFLAKRGWNGFCVEYDPAIYAELIKNYKEFTKIKFSNQKATPDKILDIFEKNDIPKTFSFLNLDIDGYDYFVLDKILFKYRPSVICTEINEKIPPPVRFTVLYDDNYKWTDAPFFGQSIQQVQELCESYNYYITMVEFNNAFLIDNKLNNKLPKPSVEKAWREGYFDKLKNKTGLASQTNTEEAVKIINDMFTEHKGEYKISY